MRSRGDSFNTGGVCSPLDSSIRIQQSLNIFLTTKLLLPCSCSGWRTITYNKLFYQVMEEMVGGSTLINNVLSAATVEPVCV